LSFPLFISFGVLFLFETFYSFSVTLLKHLDLYYSVYPGPSEAVRRSNFIPVGCYSVYPLSLCDKKGE
jgi:hypothetical protein